MPSKLNKFFVFLFTFYGMAHAFTGGTKNYVSSMDWLPTGLMHSSQNIRHSHTFRLLKQRLHGSAQLLRRERTCCLTWIKITALLVKQLKGLLLRFTLLLHAAIITTGQLSIVAHSVQSTIGKPIHLIHPDSNLRFFVHNDAGSRKLPNNRA